MELEDAQRIVANLTTLRVWFEGTKEVPGALSKIDKLNYQLEVISEQVTRISQEQIDHIQETLSDTVNSALLLKNDKVDSEFDLIIKAHTDKLPAQIARIILKVLEKQNNSNVLLKDLKLELRDKEMLLQSSIAERQADIDRTSLYKSFLTFTSILALVLSITVFGLVAILFIEA
jgi:hypothetical protein